MSKKSYFLQPELTLTKLGIRLILTKCSKHNSQMFFVFFFTLGINKNVVDKHHDEHIQIIHEHFVHEIPKIGRGVGQTKRHHGVLIPLVTSGESGLGNISPTDLQLVITSAKINFLENSSPI